MCDASYEVARSRRSRSRLGSLGLYDDFSDTRLTGRFRLSRESRRTIARWVMFLRSETVYEWPTYPRWRALAFLPIDVLTLGATARIRHRRWRQVGEFYVWPYRHWSDYRAAIRRPVYLADSARRL